MADMKITVIITGIVFCRPTEAQLESLFLHVDKHELNLKITKTHGSRVTEETHLIPENSRIEITSTNTQSFHPDELNDDISFDWVVDIDSLQDRAGGRKISMLVPPAVPLSYLTVANAVCYTAKLSNQEYQFWKLEGGMRTPLEGETLIGQEIGIDFFVGEGGNVQINVSNTESQISDTTYNFPYEAEVEYQAKLDNACIDMTCGEDFHFYYEVLDGHGIQIEETLADPTVMSGENACNPGKGDPTCELELYFLEGKCS